MPESREIILKLQGVKTYFPIKAGVFKRTANYVKAVDGVDLNVYRGETLGLVGESGCGKTTLGKTVLQLLEPTEGKIIYNDRTSERDLCHLNAKDMMEVRKKLQIVFQDPHSSLNPAFTIFGSLQDPLKMYGIKSKAERRKIIGDLLESVNMRREHMDLYPHEFSGGQRQRIGVARALSIEPDLIVCDEAVSALDVSIQAQVLKLLKEIKKERNLSYIFITHDLSVVEYISDRVAVMYLGKIVELADVEDLYASTMHPYTTALLSAIPVADLDRKSKRIILEGDVPSPVDPPSGCSFHPRCSQCQDICRTEIPPLKKYVTNSNEHYSSCHFAEKQLEK
jgi:oligopeptide/dipeptide ABC transporter ATP-binding protein